MKFADRVKDSFVGKLLKMGVEFDERSKSPEYKSRKWFDKDKTVVEKGDSAGSYKSKLELDKKEFGNPCVESRYSKQPKSETDGPITLEVEKKKKSDTQLNIVRESREGAEPETEVDVSEWFEKAFGRKPEDDPGYFEEWQERWKKDPRDFMDLERARLFDKMKKGEPITEKDLPKFESKEEEVEKESAKLSPEAQEFISKKIKTLREEGKDEEQAAAIAYQMAREKGFDVPEKKQSSKKEAVKGSKERAYELAEEGMDASGIFEVIVNEFGMDNEGAMELVEDVMTDLTGLGPSSFKNWPPKTSSVKKEASGKIFDAIKKSVISYLEEMISEEYKDDPDMIASYKKFIKEVKNTINTEELVGVMSDYWDTETANSFIHDEIDALGSKKKADMQNKEAPTETTKKSSPGGEPLIIERDKEEKAHDYAGQVHLVPKKDPEIPHGGSGHEYSYKEIPVGKGKKASVEKKAEEVETPNIQRWYNHGMGTASIKAKLIEEFGYSEEEASKLISEIIYEEKTSSVDKTSKKFKITMVYDSPEEATAEHIKEYYEGTLSNISSIEVKEMKEGSPVSRHYTGPSLLPKEKSEGPKKSVLVEEKKKAEISKKADFLVQVSVSEFDTKQVADELGRKDLEGVAKDFAQNLIDRYYSVEYLDIEALEGGYIPEEGLSKFIETIKREGIFSVVRFGNTYDIVEHKNGFDKPGMVVASGLEEDEVKEALGELSKEREWRWQDLVEKIDDYLKERFDYWREQGKDEDAALDNAEDETMKQFGLSYEVFQYIRSITSSKTKDLEKKALDYKEIAELHQETVIDNLMSFDAEVIEKDDVIDEVTAVMTDIYPGWQDVDSGRLLDELWPLFISRTKSKKPEERTEPTEVTKKPEIPVAVE